MEHPVSPLYLVATIRPRPDRIDEARAALRTLIAASLAEEGCEMYDLVQTDEAPDTWLMLEKWSSREQWESHMLTDHNAAFGKIAPGLVSEPITLAFYDAV